MNFNKKILVAGMLLWNVAESMAQVESDDQGTVNHSAGRQIEEIIVQARRRDESLQEVPLAVTALSGDVLRQQAMVTTEDLRQKVPSLYMTPATGRRDTVTLGIRSQQNIQSRLDQDPSVAVYFSEVTMARPYGINQGLYDLESIQVLKGPQGTLFGRNTTGGAMLIQPNRPSHDLEGSLEMEMGNYDSRIATGVLNLPVTDELAVRLAGRKAKRDGFTKNLLTGDKLDEVDNYSLRAAVLYRPNDRLENHLVYDSYSADDSGTSSVLSAIRPAGLGPIFFPGIIDELSEQNRRGAHKVALDAETYSKVDVQGLANTTTLELEDITIKNIVGWRRTELNAFNDLDGSPFPILHSGLIGKAEQFSEEFQVQGTSLDKAVEWIIGGYYFTEKGSDFTPLEGLAGSLAFTNGGRAKNVSKSVFGQGTYRFSAIPDLSLTIGARYTWDTRYIDYRPTFPDDSCAFLLGGLPADPCSVRDDEGFTSPTWSVGLDYQITEQVLSYIVTRRGYRSGGFNITARDDVTAFPPFDQEKVTDVEIGLKSDLFVGEIPVRTNMAVYYAKSDDLQRSISPGTIGVRRVVNAAEAKFYGLELELTAELTERLMLSTYYSYDEASYDNFVDGCVDVSDSRIPNAPKNKLGVGLRYQMNVADGLGDVVLGADYYYQGSVYTNM
ncbi:MAG: TonB-dependent receptor [Porticoccaceae bacterium]